MIKFQNNIGGNLRGTGGSSHQIIRWGIIPQYLESVIANWHSKRDWERKNYGPDETPVTVTDLQARIWQAYSVYPIIKRFCLCVFGRVAFVYCLSVCVQHKSKSSERILAKFSEKVSNDKICNCTAIPCTLLTGYHLVGPNFSIWGWQKKCSPPNFASSFRQCKIIIKYILSTFMHIHKQINQQTSACINRVASITKCHHLLCLR